VIIIADETILETSLTHPGKDNIYMTKADSVVFSVKASLPQNSGGGDDDSTKTVYSDIKYAWSFSPDKGTFSSSSGNRSFSKLTAGAKNTLTAEIKVTCTKTSSTRTWIESSEKKTDENGQEIEVDTSHWSEWSSTSETYTIGTGSASIDVYTRPGDFSEFDFTKDTII
jgi:hypothetical protein